MQQVTIVRGKESIVVNYSLEDGQSTVLAIKKAIEATMNIPMTHQKLLYRGKELKETDVDITLASDAKMMLLFTQAYYKNQPTHPSSASTKEEEIQQPKESRSSSFSNNNVIDLDALAPNQMLVEVTRGKVKYQLLCERTETIASVKDQLSGITGVDATAMRFIIKGKSPDNTLTLDQISTNSNMLKCMVLFTAKHHVLMEKEDELRQLVNEVALVQTLQQRLQKQLSKNAMAREEALVQFSTLLDRIRQLESNLEIVNDQLQAVTKTTKRTTIDTITHAITTCQSIRSTVERMLQNVSLC